MLEAAAESHSERRVVARVFDHIRRFHDKKEEEAALANEVAQYTPSGWHSAPVRDLWAPILAERLADEAKAELEQPLAAAPVEVREKMLRAIEADASAEARQKIDDLWAGLDAEANGRVATAQARLSALARGVEPVSSAIAPREGGGMEEGRRRGREEREAREAKADDFGAGLRTVGRD